MDTLVVHYNGRKEKIRLLCVDTEESCHPDKKRNTAFGKQTSAHVRSLLRPGETVFLEFESGNRRGRYGRLLAYVFMLHNGKLVNLNVYLVRAGCSRYYIKYGSSKLYNREFLKAVNN